MGWNAVARSFSIQLVVAAFAVMSATGLTGCDSRETILVIEKPTEVLALNQASESQGQNVQPGQVIATLNAGEKVTAMGVYHGNGFDGFQVKLADGTVGLIAASDTFKVISR